MDDSNHDYMRASLEKFLSQAMKYDGKVAQSAGAVEYTDYT